MWELNNDQRRCLGLDQVAAHWRRIPVKASPYDDFETVAYLEDDVVRKCINSGGDCYIEYQLNERVTPDGRYLLPRTERGKPVLLSSANLKSGLPWGCVCCSARGAPLTCTAASGNAPISTTAICRPWRTGTAP